MSTRGGVVVEDEPDEVESHEIDAFDDGTAVIVMSDGSLRVSFPLMPPSWRCEDGAFDSFEDKLAVALGVAVDGLDKEFFGIPAPAQDTIERLRAHLFELRRRHELKERTRSDPVVRNHEFKETKIT